MDNKHMNQKDTLYQSSQGPVAAFEFNEAVVPVFQDMIQRSVPGYQASIDIILTLAQKYLQDQDLVYDLGCSLGAVSLALHYQASLPSHKIIAIDQSPAMIKGLKDVVERYANDQNRHSIQVIQGDLLDMAFKPHRLSILNYVLQFIPLEHREALLENICQTLLPGGLLVVSEKIAYEDANESIFINTLHEEFKWLRGYSRLEIAGKRSALDNVLIPETLETHKKRLLACGFSSVHRLHQNFNFVTLVAVK